VIRISQYIREIREGQLDPKATPEIVREGPAWALVDARWGFGHEAARFSMATAIDLARKSGVAAVSTVRCNHIGRLGEWGEQAAAAGLIGMACVSFGHAGSLWVTPHGGAGRALSTDPLTIGAPRPGNRALLADFATSASPEGKVRVARDKGVPLPAGVLVDKAGYPSTDPNDLYAGGALLPAAAHKGYVLGFMVELLSMAVSGAFEPEMMSEKGVSSGSFYLAIDPAAFGPVERYARGVETLAQRMKSIQPAPGFQEVLLPGEPEHRTRESRAAGVSLPPATWQAIAQDARSVGVEVPSV
jgi:LDH2 family malate/lactate/ureidoglycolate dehydrogenase